MKKVLIISIILLTMTSCKTQEELKNEKKDAIYNKIKNDINISEIPKSVKSWLLDTKTEKVLTIICMSTSKKCEKIKKTLNEINDIKSYYIDIDKQTEEEKEIYKNTYELENYTGYLPYMYITEKGKLKNTINDIYAKEDMINFINSDE